MRGGSRRGIVGAAAFALVAVLCTACGGPPPEPTTLPTFPPSTTSAAAGAPTGPDDGDVPDDCARMLAPADLGALLGLPLDSVDVRTTIGVAEPSVGRTERVACRYTGSAAGPARGTALLELNVSAYTDPDAASKQWRTNADVEDGTRTEMPIGDASAVLVERPRESVLMVAYNTSNLTFVLPDRPLPGDRPRGEVLVDLALRVLPTVAQATSSPAAPPPSPTPSATAASEAAGGAS